MVRVILCYKNSMENVSRNVFLKLIKLFSILEVNLMNSGIRQADLFYFVVGYQRLPDILFQTLHH